MPNMRLRHAGSAAPPWPSAQVVGAADAAGGAAAAQGTGTHPVAGDLRQDGLLHGEFLRLRRYHPLQSPRPARPAAAAAVPAAVRAHIPAVAAEPVTAESGDEVEILGMQLRHQRLELPDRQILAGGVSGWLVEVG